MYFLNKSAFFIIAFLSYVLIAMVVYCYGHFHEDAYILYIFAENLAQGNGISYFPGAEPAEGATDFLWLILLAGLSFLNIDIAVASFILNGLGIAIIVWVADSLNHSYNESDYSKVITRLLLCLLIVSSQLVQASFAGFSVGLYCGLISIMIWLLLNEKFLYLLPLMSLLLGLFRPDGVLIGFVVTAMGLFLSYKSGLRMYLAVLFLSFILGVGYFWWRFMYFGHLLPLPLYVKSSNVLAIPGFWGHLGWLKSNAFIACAVCILFLLNKEKRRFLTIVLPFVLLFIALLFAIQSQNVSYRFQAPGTLAFLLIIATYFNLNFLREKKANFSNGSVIFCLVVLAIIFNIRSLVGRVENLIGDSYINYFPYHLAEYITDDTRIGLTEAGRFAYWLKGEKYDLVGLSTAETAIDKVSVEYLKKINADILFISTSNTANFKPYCEKDFCKITLATLNSGITDHRQWQNVSYGVKRAPLAVYDYLANTGDTYQIYIVKYGLKNYKHLYALSKNAPIDNANFELALKKSFSSDGKLSYAEMKRK